MSDLELGISDLGFYSYTARGRYLLRAEYNLGEFQPFYLAVYKKRLCAVSVKE